MPTKRVQIIRMEPQSPTGNHESTRDPARGESENSTICVDCFFYTGSTKHLQIFLFLLIAMNSLFRFCWSTLHGLLQITRASKFATRNFSSKSLKSIVYNLKSPRTKNACPSLPTHLPMR